MDSVPRLVASREFELGLRREPLPRPITRLAPSATEGDEVAAGIELGGVGLALKAMAMRRSHGWAASRASNN